MKRITDFTVDDGVPLNTSKRRPQAAGPRDPAMAAIVDKFAAMKPGQSFFIEGATRKDVDYLRRPFRNAGLGYIARYTECDEIYQVAGVRVWRQLGEYDEL